jgi:3''5''-cyclic nucleotide phosphodiesterase.
MYTIKKYNIIDSIGTQEKVLNSYLEKLESLYYPNPYHNNCHGADVMCSFLYLITSSSVITFMSTIELLGTIIGCLGHDVGHKGKNNRFHIMTRDPLSVLYNDISVLEMMHSSTVFDLLGNPAFDFLKSLNFDSFL